MKRRYVVSDYGPGFCRNGHARSQFGQRRDGGCKQCAREKSKRYYQDKVKPARKEEKVRAEALDVDLLRAKVEADVAEMRARAAAARRGEDVYEPLTRRELKHAAYR